MPRRPLLSACAAPTRPTGVPSVPNTPSLRTTTASRSAPSRDTALSLPDSAV